MLLSKSKAELKETHENLWIYDQNQKAKPIILGDKVDEFINWYSKNMAKGIREPIEMRDFIEKMAVWYELRYPDYEINRLMPCTGQEITHVSDIMFRNNHYILDLLDENSDVKKLDWDDFYNLNAFVNSLPWAERCFLLSPRYQDIVFWNCSHSSTHLHLDENGVIIEAENIHSVIPSISDKDLKGKNIKELVLFLKENGIKIPIESEFESAIRNYENRVYQKEEMLNCVMYRIIERGGYRIGPRRAFLFAKEFGRNIDIPMIYGVDRSDPGLRLFINNYIKSGGSKDLVCYDGYFARTNKHEKLSIITIQELIRTQNNNAGTFYTTEEDELHQKLINVLARRINQENLKEKQENLKPQGVKELRLQRKK